MCRLPQGWRLAPAQRRLQGPQPQEHRLPLAQPGRRLLELQLLGVPPIRTPMLSPSTSGSLDPWLDVRSDKPGCPLCQCLGGDVAWRFTLGVGRRGRAGAADAPGKHPPPDVGGSAERTEPGQVGDKVAGAGRPGMSIGIGRQDSVVVGAYGRSGGALSL